MSFDRAARVITPLGEGILQLRSMHGQEGLSKPFSFELELISDDPTLDLDALLGESLTIELEVPGLAAREFSGHVTELSLIGGEGRYAAYRARVEPWLKLLSYNVNNRVFQFMTIPEVITKVFRDRGYSDFDDRLTETYQTWDYLVQYQESDFAFASRLMERAGIYYSFRHEGGVHFVVLTDSSASHGPRAGAETIPYFPPGGEAQRDQPHVSGWQVTHRLRPGAAAAKSFDFERPRAELSAARQSPELQGGGTHEVFQYPTHFRSSDEGETVARVMVERQEVGGATIIAEANVRPLAAGDTFSLKGFPRADQNKEYLVTGASYSIALDGYQTGFGSGGSSDVFRASLEVIDATAAFRPALSIPRPVVEGPQTALVVGRAGEEIWTDDYGRVKVKFHWDRESKSDENSSCWIRVSQAWAGDGFGGIHIPRIGQEVIVDFLEGDPDRPIITGRVYNFDNRPPYELPMNQSQSGFKTRSTKGGNASKYNELRFEDKEGAEQIYLQAEKDLDTLVKDAESRQVGTTRTTNIGTDELLEVGENRTVNVTQDETHSVGGQRNDLVSTNATYTVEETLTVNVNGERSQTVVKNDSLVVSGKRSQNIHKNDELLVGKKLVIEAGDQVVLKSGSASITLKSNGDIVLDGSNIKVTGSGKLRLTAASNLVLSGANIQQN
jgi:type VI secretion system secreted protein VgrG